MEPKRFLPLAVIRQLFTVHRLESVVTVTPIHSGFRNNLHLINEKYILKVCGEKTNEQDFVKEAYFYTFFRGKIPVPNVVIFDNSKQQIPYFYMIYELIAGDTLFSRWSTFGVEEKRQVVQALARILKTINTTDFTAYSAKFGENTYINWKAERLNRLHSAIEVAEQNGLLNNELIARIEQYVERNSAALDQQKLGITYWDLHFDNVLVAGTNVVGLLDFEGVRVMSIDYALDTIRRLSHYPEIYAPDDIDEEVQERKAEYRPIFTWFKTCYPELFDFQKLEQRLNLYSIEYDLRLLEQFPNTQSLKDRLQTYLTVR